VLDGTFRHSIALHSVVAELGRKKPVNTFLIAISWSDPEEVAAYKRVGLDDDPCCSTGIFIHADSAEDALSWGNAVATKYMEFLFQQKNYAPEALDVYAGSKQIPRSPVGCIVWSSFKKS